MHLHPCMLKAVTLSNILRQSVERQAGSLQQTICTSNHLHNTTALAPLLRHAQPQVSHPKGESLHNTHTFQMTALSPTVSPLQIAYVCGKIIQFLDIRWMEVLTILFYVCQQGSSTCILWDSKAC